MTWILAAVGLFALFFFYMTRPSRVVRTLNFAAQTAAQRKDWASAAKYSEESHRAASGLKEPQRGAAESQIDLSWADALYRQGQLNEAEDTLRRGLVKAREHFAPESGMLLQAEILWGDLCSAGERHGEAEQHYRKALDGDDSRGNKGGVVFALRKLADSLLAQERAPEAEASILRALELEAGIVSVGVPPAGSAAAPRRVISMMQPDLHFCRGEYEDARRLYREKVDFWASHPACPPLVDLARLETCLAAAEARMGHLAEAVEMYSRAEATLRTEFCESHPKTVAVRAARAVVMHQMEQAG